MRQAAVDALADFFETVNGLPIATEATPELLELCLLLYNSLLDDDEWIRDSGAATVSKLLDPAAAHSTDDYLLMPLIVPAARHKLLEFLKLRFHNSSALWTESLHRLVRVQLTTSIETQGSIPSSPPKALLEDVRRDDTALFVEEKQNLYIDEAHEAGVWQEVLLSIDRRTIDTGTLDDVHDWALEGVDALIEAAEKEVDGPLGWTSKPDVFTLGVRILLAAEMLLRSSELQAIENNDKGLCERLRKLLLVGQKRNLRPAWMRMLCGILGDTIEAKI